MLLLIKQSFHTTKKSYHGVIFLLTFTLLLSTMQQSSTYTIVIGLNPALQKRFILAPKTPYLIPGNVHRANEIQEGIGGKGQDVYVALHCLSSVNNNDETICGISRSGGSDENNNNSDMQINNNISAAQNHVKLVQFLGKGVEGDTVLAHFINQYDKDFDMSLTIRNKEKLRICTTIVNAVKDESDISSTSDSSTNTSSQKAKKAKILNTGSTELIEPSGTIHQHEIEELCHAVESMRIGPTGGIVSSEDENSSVNGICFMGTMPPGCPASLYATLYRSILSRLTSSDATNFSNVPLCLIDSVIGLNHLFHEMNVYREVTRKTNMLKINMAELLMITNTKIDKIHDIANTEIDQVRTAMKGFYIMYPESRRALSFVAITNGAFPAFMVHVGNDKSTAEDKTTYDVIYRFSIPKLSPMTTRPESGDYAFKIPNAQYTIGAGDAVAACTLAAWEYLTNRKTDQRLDERVRASLLKSVVFGEDIGNTAFSFGLACGTASCIEKENSVFNVSYALYLFEQMERPKQM